MDMNDDDGKRRRNRTTLFALFGLFFGVMLVAGILRFSGWQPAGMKNHGELLKPPVDLRDHAPALQSGGEYAWNPGERRWRVLVAPPAGCGDDCLRIARELDLVRQLVGSSADRVDLLWLGAPPPGAVASTATRVLRADPALRAKLPRVDDPAGVPVYVVDPNGFVILRYPPGSDPGGLREDLVKLLKLI
jgi:hypothetical protein